MSKKVMLFQLGLGVMALAVAGCASTGAGGVETRAYIADKARVDQNMEGGNYGYVTGTPIKPDTSAMSKSRKVYVLEFTKNPDVTPEDLRREVPPVQPVQINVPERRQPAAVETYRAPTPVVIERGPYNDVEEIKEAPSAKTPTEYVIEKGDTLQKISKKVYNTYKNWYKIYEANKDIIADPNRIKPGLTIRIP
ncbi:MAG: LysM peptidoglycan-binding domain-containing protein [Candidatus Omnitrophica bacterium]|nr:LysM peptidoglycan-binding domain-containing protein [Candidatus Omnitrophota bacterium]